MEKMRDKSAIAIQMPELVQKFLAFLPPSDLLSCTRVSPVWEGEARKYLLDLVPTRLIGCSTVSQYFEDMRPRGHRHSHLKLATCPMDECVSTLAKLREENCLQKVTLLFMDVPLSGEWSKDFVQCCANLANLKRLELRPFRRGDDAGPLLTSIDRQLAAHLTYLSSPQGDFNLPSVSTLVWHLDSDDNRPEWISCNQLLNNYIVPPIARRLPSVVHLKIYITEFEHSYNLLSKSLTLFPKVSSLSILHSNERNANCQSFPYLHYIPPPITLTKLTFNLFKYFYNTWKSWDGVLSRFASSLEHLTIREVPQVWPEYGQNKFILFIPILPRLKVLAIFVSREDWELDSNPRRDCVQNVLELELKFATASLYGVMLNYATQFPSLVKLELGQESQKQCRSDDNWFQTCLQFLHSSFLAPPSRIQGHCRTLRLLIIPMPLRNKTQEWKLEVCPKCSNSPNGLPTLTTTGTELVRRIETVFPNLQNLQRYRQSLT